MTFLTITRRLAVLGLLLAVGVSCSNDDDTPPTPTFDIMESTTSLGKVLTDGNGKTLYFFSKDAAGASVCTGTCLDNWPIFSVATLKLGTGLTSTDFGTITRADSKTQVTYKGWPLYYFKNDAAAGDVKGEGVGTVWYAAKTTYSVMLANTQLIGSDGKSYKSDYTEGTGETQFFVDDMGRTLYAFIKDKKNKNNFTKADFSNDGTWPIYTAEIKEIPSVLDKSLFAVIDVYGKKQLTYRGWPLYYYGSDNKVRGATKGVSFPSPGVWPIVQKDSPNAPE